MHPLEISTPPSSPGYTPVQPGTSAEQSATTQAARRALSENGSSEESNKKRKLEMEPFSKMLQELRSMDPALADQVTKEVKPLTKQIVNWSHYDESGKKHWR